MANKRLLDRENQPEMGDIRKWIGREVLPVWEDVREYLAADFPDFESELIFYNQQHGWALRYRKEAQQLVALFPERRAFSALIILSPEEDDQALEKINYFNNKFREALNSPSPLPQGRWLWVRIEDHTDFVGLRLLLDAKKDLA